MRPITFNFGNLAAASATNIALSQGPITGGNSVTLNGSTVVGGVAILDQARRVLITSVGNDSGITFTVTGTNRYNAVMSETLTGGNVGAVNTNNDFLTVTKIVANGTTASTITVGTTTIASIMVPLEMYGNPTNISLNFVVTGTVNYTVNETWDDPYNLVGLYPANQYPPNWVALAALTGKTTTSQAGLTATARALQVVINSGSGSLLCEIVQAGILTV